MPRKVKTLKLIAMFILEFYLPGWVQRNDRLSNWRAEVKTCHRYLIKKPMFSMDYIIPAIDLTEPSTWIDAFSAGRGGGLAW